MNETLTPTDFADLTRARARGMLKPHGFGEGKLRDLWKRVYRELADPFGGEPTGDRKVDALRERFFLSAPEISRESRSEDGLTRKFLFRLKDGQTIETVLMRQAGRHTACVSTQAGCAQGCVFCATGQGGFRRHLTAGEMVAQIRHVARVLAADGERLRNIVLMGMGEPLHNYESVRDFLEIVQDDLGLGIAPAHATLSTVGLVPGILRMAREKLPAHLALSLHAANDADRAALLPVARRWPLAELMSACDEFTAARREKIFYEWTLVGGKNDSPAHARELAVLLLPRAQYAHVNLIPLNVTDGYDGAPTPPERVREFQRILSECGIPATVRSRRGLDVAAGCGQLAEVAKRRP